MFRQYATREWFNLAKRHSFKSARALKAKAKSANAAKQIKNAQLHHITLPANHSAASPLIAHAILCRRTRSACHSEVSVQFNRLAQM